MAPTGVFLGLEHDMTEATFTGEIAFWARAAIETKVFHSIKISRVKKSFPPGQASKFYGLSNFFNHGCFGKVGKAGLNAIKERQYSHDSTLTQEIERAFAFMEDLVRLQPRRVISCIPATVDLERFVGASDAAYDDSRGSGGFLVVANLSQGTDNRQGRVVTISPTLYQIWKPGATYIAQLELLMVLVALLEFPETFRGKRGIWFIDNTAALMALVRGRSNNADLDQLSILIHAVLFSYQCWMYFEWVESKGNWADGISRTGHKDEWHRRHHFVASSCNFLPLILRLPMRGMVLTSQFL